MSYVTSKIIDDCVTEFKFPSPKAEQRSSVSSLLEGKDVVAVLPTGFGKSLIYQLYLCAARKIATASGKASPIIFVVSPLKSIVADQIKDLEDIGAKGTSLLGDNVLEELEKSKFDVVFGSAEQFLAPSFLQSLRKCEKVQQRISLVVVDECHTVETWGKGKGKKKARKATKAFRSAFGNLSTLRSFSPDIPALALTGTANGEMLKAIKESLAIHKNSITIRLSPERENLRYSVVKSSRQAELSKLNWLVESLKANGIKTPKTIIFCSTMNDIANVLGYLLSRLGDHAYANHLPKSATSRLVGLYHSMTLDKNKHRVYDSFKLDKGVVRVVIASSALSMGVNFKDVRYVIHLGPARSLVDHVQESGRAGRDGQLAHNVIIYHGQRLSFCEQDVKDFVKSRTCLRKALFMFFDVEVASVVPGHNCCTYCSASCTCGGDTCNQETFPFESQDIADSDASEVKTREVNMDDKAVLQEALHEYRESLVIGTSSLFDMTACHGLSDLVINDILDHACELFTLEDLLANVPLFSVKHALSVLEIFHEIFEDIPSVKDVLASLPQEDEFPFAQLDDLVSYFDESDSDIDADLVNVSELENL